MKVEVNPAELARQATWSVSLASLLGGIAYWIVGAYAAPLEAAALILVGATGIGGILGRKLDGEGRRSLALQDRIDRIEQLTQEILALRNPSVPLALPEKSEGSMDEKHSSRGETS